LRRAAKELVSTATAEDALGTTSAGEGVHLDLHEGRGVPDGGRIGAARQERDAVSCLLGLYPYDLAAEVALERTEVGTVIAWGLEVEAHREG
jgi:hypothetical protein